MFTYCENTPANMFDPSGCDPTPQWAVRIVNGNGSYADYVTALSVNPAAWMGSARSVVNRAVEIAETYFDNIALYSEHNKKGTTNPANRNKHEKGQTRKQRDSGKEKGDARRRGNPNKRRNNFGLDDSFPDSRITYLVGAAGATFAVVYLVANDASGIGIADDGAIAPLIPIIWDNVQKFIS